MNRSSAGANSKAPPQTMQPFVFFTTSLISLMVRFTGHNVSTRSAVPAGEVTALDEVLGMTCPAAAMSGTIRIDVLSPGIPPMLCLSRIGPLSNVTVRPVLTIAFDRASTSSMLMPWI